MSVRRTSRDKKRTPSPIIVYPNEAGRPRKSALFNNIDQIMSTNRQRRRGSSREQFPKCLKSNTKYRIVTEPIEHFSKIQHLANSNVFGNTSLCKTGQRLSHQKHQQFSQKKIKLGRQYDCSNCAKLRNLNARSVEQLEYYKAQIEKIIAGLDSWRAGKLATQAFRKETLQKGQTQNVKLKQSGMVVLKSSIEELVMDIETLSKIDLLKMLKSEVFTYQGLGGGTVKTKVQEARAIIAKLKGVQQLQVPLSLGVFSNQELMLRNLHLRLNNQLRQNLQLKIRNQLSRNVSNLNSVNSDFLRIAIQNVMKE